MSWIDSSQYNPHDTCPICYEKYGTNNAIYKTDCNHIFHNDCLNEYCEHTNGNITCPVCRADVGDACNAVWAFKEKMLGNESDKPLFDGNPRIMEIYNRIRGGRKTKRRMNIIKRRKTKRRMNIIKRRKTKKEKNMRNMRKKCTIYIHP